MSQIGLNVETANFGTYNDVAGDQTNNNYITINIPGFSSSAIPDEGLIESDSYNHLLSDEEGTSKSAELLAPLRAVCGGIVGALETTRAADANKDAWGNLVDKILKTQKAIEEQVGDRERDGKQSRSPLTADATAVAALRDFTMSLGKIFEAGSDALKQSNKGQNTLKHVLIVRIYGEKIQQYTRAVDDCFQQYMVAITLSIARYTKEQADLSAIGTLKIAKNSSGNQHQTCTDKTRVQVLKDIRKWAEDTTTTNQLFWLVDGAGTGKSTVAKQIANDWEREEHPVVSFFFSINAADTRSNAKFCSTIAAKLADLPDFGSFRPTLAEVLGQKLTVKTSNLEGQFEKLLCAPLKETNRPVLLIIDALDECDKMGRRELLSVLLSNLKKLPMVKVMITSRPEPDIVNLLQANGLVRSSDLRGTGDLDSPIQDVLQYISHFFAHSDKLRGAQSYAPKLAEAANGLFIYASTACKYLQDSQDPDAALEKMENICRLDDLYSQIMERAIPKNDRDSLRAVSFILQTILAAQRPLSVSEMQKLLKKGQVVQNVVGSLASVLSSGAGDKPVEILHPTFREYLSDRNRSEAYYIDVQKGHKSLAVGCLKICSENTAEELLEAITSALEYAALYWPNHVIALLRGADAQEDTQSLENRIISFFEEDLTRWFELIVLLKAVYQCSNNLATLEGCTGIPSAIATSPTSRTHERTHWCRDAHRFLQYHQLAIEQGYMYIRRALAFTPRESLIYKAYFTAYARQIPTVLCGIPMEWPSNQILSGHTESISSVSFSPDGTRIVSGSEDKTLRLWDGVTGASIGGPMKGHTRDVTTVAFSPDGTRIVSGSWDHTLRLWDGATGASIGRPMKGHTRDVNIVAFSPDGTRIVSGSRDHTLRLWDSMIGAGVSRPMKEHAFPVNSVAFSPDGTRIVSGSLGSALQLWDGSTGASISGPMMGHVNSILSVSFSPDGTRIVSGSKDNTLRLWDSVTGTSIGGPMKGHTRPINSVAFSPDGTRIVSGSWDKTLRLWDGLTGASIGGPMKGHVFSVSSVGFSPDGTRIVSGSRHDTLRLWDGVTGTSIGGPMKGHTRPINSVAFSPDGTRIVSGSEDRTLRLWDVASCAEVTVIHTNILDPGFSPCGSYIVSQGRAWDIRSLPPSLVTGTNHAVSYSPFRYDQKTRMLEVHASSILAFPVSGCQVSKWVANGGRIALGLADGRVVIIDCTHLL